MMHRALAVTGIGQTADTGDGIGNSLESARR